MPDELTPVNSHVLEEAGHPPPHLLAQIFNRGWIGRPGHRAAHVGSLPAEDLLRPGVVHVLHDRALRKAARADKRLTPERRATSGADHDRVGLVLNRPVKVEAE